MTIDRYEAPESGIRRVPLTPSQMDMYTRLNANRDRANEQLHFYTRGILDSTVGADLLTGGWNVDVNLQERAILLSPPEGSLLPPISAEAHLNTPLRMVNGAPSESPG